MKSRAPFPFPYFFLPSPASFYHHHHHQALLFSLLGLDLLLLTFAVTDRRKYSPELEFRCLQRLLTLSFAC